jgi:hypothetical protein
MKPQIQNIANNQNETNMGIIPKDPSPSPLINTQGYFNELSDLNSVDIVQKTSYIDYLFLCTENVFQVHYPDKQKRILYEMYENSDCCERCCCFRFRSFNMKINNLVNQKNPNSIILDSHKTCALPCIYGFGCGKPEITIDIKSPVQSHLGKVRMNYESCVCAICDNHIDITDKSGNLRYVIKKNDICIGCFFACAGGCCCKCCSINFDICENNNVVGSVTKLTCDRCRICATKADIYTLIFPPNATPEEKMLLIMGTILLDSINF